ncbi:MAG: hypothetical protein ACTHZ5_15980 [Micrococcaceae bacterium]
MTEQTSEGTYLPMTIFDSDDPRSYYEAEVDADGLIVYSECCAERMGPETARLVHEALGRWLADREHADT